MLLTPFGTTAASPKADLTVDAAEGVRRKLRNIIPLGPYIPMYCLARGKNCSMKILFTLPKILLLLPVLALFGGQADAQAVQDLESIKSQAELDKAIASLDAVLFDSYDRCDLEKFATFLADDVEFYHDLGGVTLGKEKLTDSVKKNICGKVSRELVPGTLQIYHMKGYGAVEMGVHRFHHPGHDDTEPVGEGKFIHLWQYKDGAWKITRGISYGHHAAVK